MDGVLVVAKPIGPTSHDVVGLIRRLAATKRVGHGGTLDPFASGVLPVFLGKATRLVEYHLGDRKRYRATVCFGASSTTDDLEGALTPAGGPVPDRSAVDAALERFRGEIEQRPPAYSAIKVAGRRAYAMARAGQSVELEPRSVTIDAIEIVSWDETTPGEPVAVIDVACSAGTYVRSLARDLGAAVGSGAYLGALVRTASGPFTLDEATELDAVRAAAEAGPEALAALLQPIDAGLDLATVVVPDGALTAIGRGQAIGVPAGAAVLPADAPIRLVDQGGRLVAIARLAGTKLAPDKVLLDGPAAADAAASPPA
jgi:tRNA pseudouridine55 synthase